jgi:serine-type D-Ala-D-Ala carboxypeptidase/endopeptidase (penicillin-binding protein 4)
MEARQLFKKQTMLKPVLKAGLRTGLQKARIVSRPALIACAGLAMCGVPSALGQEGSLNAEFSRLIANRKLGNAKVGISLYDSKSGVMLANVGGDRALIPASNHKLLTSGAAALVLGSEFVFRTEIILDGDRLIVRGSGDPAFADPEILSEMKPSMSVGDVLTVLTGAVSKAEITSIREIVIDDRVFDREFVHPSWPREQLHNRYAAQVSGLNFHGNTIAIFMRPSKDGVGRPPMLSTQPEAPWIQIVNKGRTIGNGKNTAWLQREDGSNTITLIGEVRNDGSAEVTLDGPGLFFGQVLASQLQKAGVHVGSATTPAEAASFARMSAVDEVLNGAVRAASDAGNTSETVPVSAPAGRVVAVVNTPLMEVLKKCNTDSDNLYAESMLKRVSHEITKEPGSWENGASVVRMMLTQKLGGTAAAETTIADGCGLSRQNSVAPATLVRWLDVVAEDPKVGKMYIDSMATPGSGTLKRRFLPEKGEARIQNDLHAKSGFINGVRSLSGYLINPETGRRVCFSVICNDLKGDEVDFNAKQLAEDIVRRADRWLSERSSREAKVGG